jgi:hypothetical protein
MPFYLAATWGSRVLAASAVTLAHCLSPAAGGEDVSDYYTVLSALVSFLRDHDCWATLACLLGACQQVRIGWRCIDMGRILSIGSGGSAVQAPSRERRDQVRQAHLCQGSTTCRGRLQDA